MNAFQTITQLARQPPDNPPTGSREDLERGIAEKKAEYINELAHNADQLENSLIEAQKEAERPKKTGCFIATAAYGTALDQRIHELRFYRDHYLLRGAWGSRLIKTYMRYPHHSLST